MHFEGLMFRCLMERKLRLFLDLLVPFCCFGLLVLEQSLGLTVMHKLACNNQFQFCSLSKWYVYHLYVVLYGRRIFFVPRGPLIQSM